MYINYCSILFRYEFAFNIDSFRKQIPFIIEHKIPKKKNEVYGQQAFNL